MTVTEYRTGARTIAVGDVVRISGMRGLFTVKGFDLDAGVVDVFGGVDGRRMFRTFTLDRIGVRPVEPNRRRKAAA